MLTYIQDCRTNSFLRLCVTSLFKRAYGRFCRCCKSAVPFILTSGFIVKAAIIIFLLILAAAVLFKWDDISEAYSSLEPGLGMFWLDITRVLLLLNITVFIWRTVLAIMYRPTAAVDDELLPNCTVIVPAYNEGHQVFDTLASIVNSDYPVSKLQIIAIDDGSRDDTWQWIQQAAARFSNRIETISLAKNAGKRRALYEGFIRSTGDIFVTIDSDSIIETHTLRKLVSPFVNDHRTGAVAGNVRVLNTKQGFIPKMLDVSFAFSFDFVRAGQSMVDTVFCTPGALSAYKRKPVMKHLEQWLNQTFLGKPAKIGEDRAMTNLIIRDGWKVKFQSDAIVYTNVPCKYKNLCKMLLRWARSNVRETLIMSTFIFSRFRRTRATGARINFLTSCVNLLVPRALFGALIATVSLEASDYLLQLLAGSSVWATVPAAFYVLKRKTSDALYAFAYSVFWLFGLFWITPWAMLTPANGKWLTREDNRSETPAQRVARPVDTSTPVAA
ncbi:MAG: glycosyltransferase [Phycisphaerae bacterium]|jgi:hyaluronan synthase